MSTSAEFVDHARFEQAVADLRQDAYGLNRKSWLLVGHVENNPNLVDVVATDTSEASSLGDFVERLEDDQVMYGLVRLTTAVDMSSTVKFVYVHWSVFSIFVVIESVSVIINYMLHVRNGDNKADFLPKRMYRVGERVPFARRGRFGVVHGSVETFFNPYHLVIETGNPDELSEEELVLRLDESSGTKDKTVEGSLAGRQMRGFKSNQVSSPQKGQPKSVAPRGVDVEITQELANSIEQVRDDTSEVNWVLAGFEEGDLKKPLSVVACGTGDIDTVIKYLEDDQVMYALYRTKDLIDDIETVKFVYLYWVGEQTKPLKKGKVSAFAGPVEKIFSPAHVTLSFTNRYDIEESIIQDKVMSSSGSKSHVK